MYRYGYNVALFEEKKKIYFIITMRHYEHMVQEHVILSRIIHVYWEGYHC